MTEPVAAGDRVVIIGGSSGIGRATAKRIILEGGDVAIGSRGDDRRREAVEELGESAEGYELDIADPDALEQFFETVGAFNHLVLTAAYVSTGNFEEIDASELRRAFEMKGLGYFRATKAAAPYIRGSGSVTMISAISVDRPSENYFALGMVNAAIEVLARSVAAELGPVRANVISPGTVDTWGMDETRKRELESSLPAAHVGEPEDIADAVLFCLRNPYLTGGIIRIDGGKRLQ
jgi:NAD(P)-dependent dehydrogenase (short-subunit alcohol dehydrogenase family)